MLTEGAYCAGLLLTRSRSTAEVNKVVQAGVSSLCYAELRQPPAFPCVAQLDIDILSAMTMCQRMDEDCLCVCIARIDKRDRADRAGIQGVARRLVMTSGPT